MTAEDHTQATTTEPAQTARFWPPLDVAPWEYSAANTDGSRHWIPCGYAAVARLKDDPSHVVRPRTDPSAELPAAPARGSCGLVASPSDSIERLGFIAIRYRAWMGEALADPLTLRGPGNPPTNQVLRALCGSFDMIEHMAQDFLVDSGPRSAAAEKSLANSVQDQAERMKGMLTVFGAALDKSLLTVPSMGDLELLCLACAARICAS